MVLGAAVLLDSADSRRLKKAEKENCSGDFSIDQSGLAVWLEIFNWQHFMGRISKEYGITEVILSFYAVV